MKRFRSSALHPARYTTTIECVYLGGVISADKELSIEIMRRLQRAWACFQRYTMEICDCPGVRIWMKVRMLKDEAIETLPYGCVTRSSKKATTGYGRFTTPCPPDASAGGSGSATTIPSPHADEIAKTDSESIMVTVRPRRILFAGFVERIGEERLPRRVTSGEQVGGKGYSGGR